MTAWIARCTEGRELESDDPAAFVAFWNQPHFCLSPELFPNLCVQHTQTVEKFRDLICADCRVVLAGRVGAYGVHKHYAVEQSGGQWKVTGTG